MTTLTTHVLDTSIGKPAAGVRIDLERVIGSDTTVHAGDGVTNDDGRITELLHADIDFGRGTWRLIFHTGEYFAASKRDSFFPTVEITFNVTADEHHHVPLLVSPYGYSTYRGS